MLPAMLLIICYRCIKITSFIDALWGTKDCLAARISTCCLLGVSSNCLVWFVITDLPGNLDCMIQVAIKWIPVMRTNHWVLKSIGTSKLFCGLETVQRVPKHLLIIYLHLFKFLFKIWTSVQINQVIERVFIYFINLKWAKLRLLWAMMNTISWSSWIIPRWPHICPLQFHSTLRRRWSHDPSTWHHILFLPNPYRYRSAVDVALKNLTNHDTYLKY